MSKKINTLKILLINYVYFLSELNQAAHTSTLYLTDGQNVRHVKPKVISLFIITMLLTRKLDK